MSSLEASFGGFGPSRMYENHINYFSLGNLTREDSKNYEIQRTLSIFRARVFGQMPTDRPHTNFDTVEEGFVYEESGELLGYRRQVRATLSREGASINPLLLYYSPLGDSPFSVVAGLNVYGNHSLVPFAVDSNVIRSEAYSIRFRGKPLPYSQDSHGEKKDRFNVIDLLRRGIGSTTICHTDIVRDAPGEKTGGGYDLYPELQNRPDNFSALGAWSSLGYGTMMDYIQKDPRADKNRIVAYGFSRDGKAALNAVAHDRRFAGCIATSSGRAGGGPFKTGIGEPIRLMAHRYRHWFADSFQETVRNISSLPVDSHDLLYAIQRPVLLSEAVKDWWAVPQEAKKAALLANAKHKEQGSPEQVRLLMHAGGHTPLPDDAWRTHYADFVRDI